MATLSLAGPGESDARLGLRLGLLACVFECLRRIRIRGIGPDSDKRRVCPELAAVVQEFETFVVDYIGGEKTFAGGALGEDVYGCNVFLCRGNFENNLAQWTMRLCATWPMHHTVQWLCAVFMMWDPSSHI